MGLRHVTGKSTLGGKLPRGSAFGLLFLTSLTACAGGSGSLIAAPAPARWADDSRPAKAPPVPDSLSAAPEPSPELPASYTLSAPAIEPMRVAAAEPPPSPVATQSDAIPLAHPGIQAGKTDAKIAQLQAALEAQQQALALQQKQIAALQEQLNAVRTAATTSAQWSKVAEEADHEARVAEHKRAIQTAQAAAGFAVSSTTASPPLLAATDIANANEATGATDSRETVGQKPEEKQTVPDLPTIAETGGVLTPKHTLTLEPSITASHSSRSRFLFKGVEIIPSVLVGAIDVNQVQHDYVSGAMAARYGITDRLEGFVDVPFVYRHDTLQETLLVANSGVKDKRDLTGTGIGDVDLGLQYQLTQGSERWPILTANFRAKTTTGTGPFDVPFDQKGIGTKLATGSGFWSVQPSLTAIRTMDPLVFYGSVSYLKNFGRNLNKVISTAGGDALIGQVDPGDALGFSFGGAFAITDNVSVSMGYEHYYVFPTETVQSAIDPATGNFGAPTKTKGDVAQLGSLLFGANFRTRSGGSFNVTLAAGLTDDAPDVQLTIRRPFSIDLAR
jgi:hypothetical protein